MERPKLIPWESRQQRIRGPLDPFARELRAVMAELSISQGELCRRAHRQFPTTGGITSTSISRWCTGIRAPNPKQLIALQLAMRLKLPAMEPMVSELLYVHRSYEGFIGLPMPDWPLWAVMYR